MHKLHHISIHKFSTRAIHIPIAIIGGGTAGLNVSA